ncbi:MAG: hypothetical protein EOO28_15890 [Comamonadaceae bacterium]|nr:MAG: hypothetical protein EOO28_15890 [Comamonadaceae bacterium]
MKAPWWRFWEKPVYGGNFFPPEYKVFEFREGDLLVSDHENGRYAVNKVLKVDRIELRKGEKVNIQGQIFEATEDDYFLVIGMCHGKDEFNSEAEAREAARAGNWTIQMGHTPNRAPGAATGQTWAGKAPVLPAELEGYKVWRTAFDKKEAGVF